MKGATKEFERKAVPRREQRKVMKDTLGCSLEVIQTLIKEMDDE